MLDAWRKQAELVLGLIADTSELILETIIPPLPGPPTAADKARARQLSAIFVIVILILVLKAFNAGMQKTDTLWTITLTLIYFTIASWLVSWACAGVGYGSLKTLVEPSLSVIVGFSAVSIVILVLLRGFDYFIHKLPARSFAQFEIYTVLISVAISALAVVVRSYLLAKKGGAPFSLLKASAISLLLMALVAPYLYWIA